MGTAKRKRTVVLIVCAGLLTAAAVAMAVRRGPAKQVAQPVEQKLKATPKKQPTIVAQPVEEKRAVQPSPKPIARPKVDIVFVLDTTGSMSGLLAGAKRKIWSIANSVMRGQPRPDLRIGLIGYRDLGDSYVTRRYALTSEIDDVYQQLRRLRADGGGDFPEHVNRALAEAIRKMQWRRGKVLRQVFLVGDAPPHEGRDGLYSHQLAQEAKQRGIIINAVRCGRAPQTGVAWRRIANDAGGVYASVRQDGAVIARHTPYDAKLAKLNRDLSATLLPMGGADRKAASRRRVASNVAMGDLEQADSAAFRARAKRLDGDDLVDNLAAGRAKLDKLPAKDLPKPLAALGVEGRRAYVANVRAKRASLRREILQLSKKREGYLKTTSKTSGASASPSFDDKVTEAVEAQGRAHGIAY
ncbi:MAG: VWA domain-containing protein [Deltaproteobacteria bacterium]|nr:VWA domain-containing protein [Deltaproteobacteria bacterium]